MYIVWHTYESMNAPKLKYANKPLLLNHQILIPQISSVLQYFGGIAWKCYTKIHYNLKCYNEFTYYVDKY